MKPAIQVENLSKLYYIGRTHQQHDTLRDAIVYGLSSLGRRFASDPSDQLWALKDVSFEVQPGEVVGLIGRNGAGKSTLLKILSRITEPTSGRALINGRVGSLLEVGTGFHPELTGRENIFLNGAILGMRRKEIKQRFDEIVAFAEIDKFLDTPVKRYSSGMYVRLAFAVAAHLEPEILLVDEVLAVGDMAFQKKCLGKMGQVAQGGRTVLFVSHNMDAVLGLCKQVAIVEAGRVSELMPSDEGIKQYINQSVSDETNISLGNVNTRSQPGKLNHMARLCIMVDGVQANIIKTGGALEFVVDIENGENLHGIELGIVLLNGRRQRVVVFHTRYHSGLLIEANSRISLVCKIPSLPLVPDTYLVDIILANHQQIIEKVDAAAKIHVVFTDLLGTGLLPNSNQGHVILPCTWAVQDEDK